jgi:hypothetical protein
MEIIVNALFILVLIHVKSNLCSVGYKKILMKPIEALGTFDGRYNEYI